MAYMNNVGKFKYSLYLMRQNKKLVILLNVILAVLICGIEGTLLLTSGFDGYSAIIYIILMSAFLALVISVIVPIYMMKMLYHKKSSDFYYALPIKRRDVYITHVIFGFLVSMLPIILYYMIGSLFAYRADPSLVQDLDITVSYLAKILGVILINMFAMQAMINFIAVRCNNLVDTLLLIGCYIIMPFVLLVSMTVYFDQLVDHMAKGYGNYLGIDFLLNNVLIYVSIPTTTTYQLDKMMNMSAWDWNALYWFVVSMILYLLSARYYIKRKAEQSESITNFHMGYPLMIVASVLCIMLIGFGLNLSKGITIIFTLLVYFLLLFIWKRKIYLTIKSVGVYVCLLVMCVCLQFVFVKTNGFHRIQEVPTKDYKEVQVYVQTIEKIGTLDEYTYSCTLTSNKKEGMQALKQFHQDLIESVESKDSDTGVFIEMNYGKEYDDGYRIYKVSRETFDQEVLPRIEKLKESDEIEFAHSRS